MIECTCSSLSIGFGGDAGGAGGASGAAPGGAAKLGFVLLRPPRLTLRNSEIVTMPSPFGSHSRKIACSSSLVRALLALTAYGVRRLRMVNDSRFGFLEGGGRWTHLR